MFPISNQQLGAEISALNILEITSATIRQIGSLATALQGVAGEQMVHLEMGNPGLPASQLGVDAECAALKRGVANTYPNIAGVPELKRAGSSFLKAFLDIDVAPRYMVPTVGSMQGSFTTLLLQGQRLKGRDTIAFINPGFPAQRHQAKILGLNEVSFDLLDFRGERLVAKLREIFADGRVTAILYNNPNNPAWTNLTEEELEIIGRMATEYDVTVIEDLAYMGMDFRQDFSHPYEAPFIPTIARYTDNYILLCSASKIFSYAGERIALVVMSPAVYNRRYEFFEKFYEMPCYGDAYMYGVLYACSSGTSHAAQHAMAAMMEAAASGRLDFVGECREYGRRAARAKEIFNRHGFHLVYSHDGDRPISDGFFFTVGYGDMDSAALQLELLRYGVSSISLPSTGSTHKGLRVCVSMLNNDEIFEALDRRLERFNADHCEELAKAPEKMLSYE